MIAPIGVSIALPAIEFNALTEAERTTVLRESQELLAASLRTFVGGVSPKGAFTFHADGPHQDPTQGPIYVASLSAPFDTDDLPHDSGAYATHVRDRAERN